MSVDTAYPNMHSVPLAVTTIYKDTVAALTTLCSRSCGLDSCCCSAAAPLRGCCAPPCSGAAAACCRSSAAARAAAAQRNGSFFSPLQNSSSLLLLLTSKLLGLHRLQQLLGEYFTFDHFTGL